MFEPEPIENDKGAQLKLCQTSVGLSLVGPRPYWTPNGEGPNSAHERGSGCTFQKKIGELGKTIGIIGP
jgi:hypothetical protein